jgi:hypothetical protein
MNGFPPRLLFRGSGVVPLLTHRSFITICSTAHDAAEPRSGPATGLADPIQPAPVPLIPALVSQQVLEKQGGVVPKALRLWWLVRFPGQHPEKSAGLIGGRDHGLEPRQGEQATEGAR